MPKINCLSHNSNNPIYCKPISHPWRDGTGRAAAKTLQPDDVNSVVRIRYTVHGYLLMARMVRCGSSGRVGHISHPIPFNSSFPIMYPRKRVKDIIIIGKKVKGARAADQNGMDKTRTGEIFPIIGVIVQTSPKGIQFSWRFRQRTEATGRRSLIHKNRRESRIFRPVQNSGDSLPFLTEGLHLGS